MAQHHTVHYCARMQDNEPYHGQGSCHTRNTPWGYQACGLWHNCSDCPGSWLASTYARPSFGRRQGDPAARNSCCHAARPAAALRPLTGRREFRVELHPLRQRSVADAHHDAVPDHLVVECPVVAVFRE